VSHQDTINQLTAIMQPLTAWGAMPGVEEICINEPNAAFVRRNGAWARHDIDLDYDDCYDLAILAAAIRRQTIGDNAPVVGADIPFGSGVQRLQSILPPAVPGGTVSHTIEEHQDLWGFMLLRLGRPQPNCRWRGWDTISRREAGVCHRARAFGSAAAGARRASSIASAGVWRSAC